MLGYPLSEGAEALGLHHAAICSSVFPLVSGTIVQQNQKVPRHTAAKTQNAPAADPKRCSNDDVTTGKERLARKAETHSAVEATAMPLARIRLGKISAMISHVTGAMLME